MMNSNILDEKMIAMLANQLPILASINTEETIPNIGPKRTLRMYDTKTLIFNENTGGQTLKNVKNGSKIAVAVIDWKALDGYRFLGTPEIYHDGEPLENALRFAKENNMGAPKCAVLIHIEKIFTLQSGKNAGKRL